MKSMIRVLTMLLLLSFALTACGLPVVGELFPSETSTPAPVEQTPASFGTVQAQQSPEMVSETTEAPASALEEPVEDRAAEPVDPEGSAEEPVEPEPVESPEVSLDPDADMTELLVKSALCADYINDLWYGPDSAFFWRAMGYLMYLAGPYAQAEIGSDEEGTYIRMSAESLESFEKALFGDYFEEEGNTYPDLGEETDIVKWESTPEGEFYLVHEQDLDDYTVKYEETDWADHYNATLLVNGTARAVYELTMEDAGRGELFPLRITQMAYAGKP